MQKELIEEMTHTYLAAFQYALEETGGNIQIAGFAANGVLFAAKDQIEQRILEQNRKDISEWIKESVNQLARQNMEENDIDQEEQQ